MGQPPAAAFTAFADVWPRATGNGDRRRPMRHCCGRNFDFDFFFTLKLYVFPFMLKTVNKVFSRYF